MTITVCCKASTKIGLGHLIRSASFVNQISGAKPDVRINFILIGDPELTKLFHNPRVNLEPHTSEESVIDIPQSDVLILDMIDIQEATLMRFRKRCLKTASLSPIFNHFDKIDFYFGRTKYVNFNPVNYPSLKIFAGLPYAIISENCLRISAGKFEECLHSRHFPIAVIMGGGDATNKTLNVLKALKTCRVPATLWVMLGEGYKHSMDTLIEETRKDSTHEIILAKTNRSMWHILNNCVLCITTGGVTSFEAVYAGLPAVNFSDSDSQRFLLQELVENNAAFDMGIYSPETLQNISQLIEDLYNDKHRLLQMHVNTKSLIDHQGALRILDELINAVKIS
jgi:spore coat polysaccharide biosynthesis predicted glycosyltransferase SpsG